MTCKLLLNATELKKNPKAYEVKVNQKVLAF